MSDSMAFEAYQNQNSKLITEVKRLVAENAELRETEKLAAKHLRSMSAQLAEAQKDVARLKCLRELCGYVEDGSSTHITIGLDDATRNWTITVGHPRLGRPMWWGTSLHSTIDAAMQEGK